MRGDLRMTGGSSAGKPFVEPGTSRPWQSDPVVQKILRNAGYLPHGKDVSHR